MLMSDHTVFEFLPATYTFIRKWNELYSTVALVPPMSTMDVSHGIT